MVSDRPQSKVSRFAGTRIGIVGLGLIGGSLALRLVQAECDVLAWNHHGHYYDQARARGIKCVESINDLTSAEPEIIVLCNPLRAMPEVLGSLSAGIDTSITTLTDVGSVKAQVRRQVVHAGLADCFVGAHPMAGNEHSGFGAADPALFNGARWAISVDGSTEYSRFLSVLHLVVDMVGDHAIVLNDAVHDRATALISHMPHVVATALINELTENPDRDIAAALAAGSWRDMTRVALTDPARTRAMVDEDAVNVERLLRSMAGRLIRVADALHNGNADQIRQFFAAGQPFRDFKLKNKLHKDLASSGIDDATDSADGPQLAAMAADLTDRNGRRLLSVPKTGWQENLLDSARNGEHITAVESDHRFLVEPVSAW